MKIHSNDMVVVTGGRDRGKRGKVVLYYASLEDFDRIFEILTGTERPATVHRSAGVNGRSSFSALTKF